jgi:hypothetical protein
LAFVVFAGQSNTGGAYMDASTLPAAWKADPLTLIWDDQTKAWAQMQPGVNTGFGDMKSAWGPEVKFAMDFRAEHPDEVLRIVKSAWGGTQLAYGPEQWNYDWSPNSTDELFDRTTAAIRDAGAAAGGLRPTAVFYGQGEEDANFQAAANAYAQNLPELFTAIRDEWMHDPTGKIGFYRIAGTPPYAAEVRYGEARTDELDPNAESFDSRPYPLLADGVHFSAAAHQMAGDEYFRLYEAWRDNAAAPPPGGGQVLTSNGPGDALLGGAGDDTLNASQGSDVLTGGAGADTFAWAKEPWSPARVTDFVAGQDRLDLSALLQASHYTGSDPVADGYVQLLDDGAGGAKLLLDHDGAGPEWGNYIIHLEGTPVAGLTWAKLSGSGGAASGGETRDGTAGADTLQGGAAHDHLWGGDGDDRISGGGEFDDLHGNQGNDTVAGGAGDDWVVGGKGDDGLSGGDGGDIVYGNIGNDWCDGGAGADLVRGGQGDDMVLGADGDDWLSGDRGNDTITGGAGADIFHGSQDAGIDRVTDFNRAEGDRVQLDAGTTYVLGQVGNDTVLDMGGGHQMILVGVSMSSLTPGWVFGA